MKRRRSPLLAGLVALAAGGDAGSVLPHHDWALVASEPGASALATLLTALEAGLETAGLDPGYPRRCRVDPASEQGGLTVRSCREPAAGEAADALLIGEGGGFLQLALVDFPDSRHYLFEIFLVRDAVGEGAVLPAASRLGGPRLTVGFPLVDRMSVELLPALRRGLELAGAVPVEVAAPAER